MRTLRTPFSPGLKLWGGLALAIAAPLGFGIAPAEAQGGFPFFRPFSPPVASIPAGPLFQAQPTPAVEVPTFKVRARPKAAHVAKAASVAKPARVEQAAIKAPLVPRRPGDASNPLPELLADRTLRSGDLVMFPEGLRVFTGKASDSHKLADFAPVAKAGKAVPSATRKLAAQLRPGLNTAWSADVIKAGGKLAMSRTDGGATGATKRKRR